MRSAPLAVVGTPGSGTRVFARLALAAGRDLGCQNKSNDATALYQLADRWCGRIYPAWASGRTMDYSEFEADLKPCIEAHLRKSDPAAPWGWKQPRSLYLLPALHAAHPDLLVLHVIRDGRDLAFSPSAGANVLLSGRYTLPAAAGDLANAIKAAMVWDAPNRLAADFGEQRLGDRYLRLSLEELCANPAETAARLVSLVGGAPIASDRLDSLVETPASLGRWKDEDPELLGKVEAAAGKGLRRFAYAVAA